MKVGAVLEKDGHIISSGYNGTPKGYRNCCDVHTERGNAHSAWSERFEIHAELNAIIHCPVSTEGAIMITTHSPCWNCTKHMVGAGIKEIWFAERYYRMTDDEYSAVEGFCDDVGVKFGPIPIS